MINIKHLQLIRSIHEQGSMTKAAAQLHLTQPALSHQLKELEHKLATNVFERNGRKLEITPIGNRLLETAGRVLDELDRTTKDVEKLASGKTGVLRLTTECYSCYHWMPEVLTKYQESFPDVDVQIVAEAAINPELYLKDDKIDTAIVTYKNQFDDAYNIIPLFKDEFICVFPTSHPWADLSFVEATDFTTEHLISVKDFSGKSSDIYNKLFLSKEISPKKVTTIPIASGAIIEMVNAGMGVTIMTSWAAHSYLDRYPDLSQCQLTKNGTFRSWFIVFPKRKSIAYIKEFAHHIKEAFDGMKISI